MANTRSALKRWRQSLKRRARNRRVLGATRTALKKARDAVRTSGPEAAAAVNLAASQLDAAASKGVIHRNTAARKKSRLAKHLNEAIAAEPPAAPEAPPTAEAVMAEAKLRRTRTRKAAAPPAEAPAAEEAPPAAEKPKRTRARKATE